MPAKPDGDGFDLDRSTQRWQWAGLILMALFFLAFPLFRIYEPAQRAEAREAQKSFLAAEGSELFAGNCESCHGIGGSGAVAPAIGAKEFLDTVDDEQITQLIALGVPGTEMVAYSSDFGGPLTSQEVNSITTFLRSLEEDAFSKPNWRTPLEDEDLGGDELFFLACSRCHGVDAAGIEDVAPDLSPDSLTLMETDQWIIGRITDGYKLMPRFGRILTQRQIGLIVAFLRGVDPTVVTTTTTAPDAPTTGDAVTTTTSASDLLALGKEVFEVTAGGEGCANCHGLDGKGGVSETDITGPSIIGASRFSISEALGGNITEMRHIELTGEELEAVAQYVQWLSSQE